LAAACGRNPGPTPDRSDRADAPERQGSIEPPTGPSALHPSALASTAASEPAAPRWTPERDEDVDAALVSAPIQSLDAVPNRPGTFRALLAGDRGSPREAVLTIALRSDPRAIRRALAFARLARALGAANVPPLVGRRVGIGELATLLLVPADRSRLREAALENDGAVGAVIRTASARAAGSLWEVSQGHAMGASESVQVSQWARWSERATPAKDEDTRLLRGYVEMLLLDYVTANVARRTVFVTDEPKSVLLLDNSNAFPTRPDPAALDRVLARLRVVARFPRQTYEGLRALEPKRAWEHFASGPFEDWLLTPRSLIDLEERRQALLSLIDARIAAAGPSALSL
jgi:hypothetical protein